MGQVYCSVCTLGFEPHASDLIWVIWLRVFGPARASHGSLSAYWLQYRADTEGVGTCIVHRQESLLQEHMLQVLVVHWDFSHHVTWHVTRQTAGFAEIETVRVLVAKHLMYADTSFIQRAGVLSTRDCVKSHIAQFEMATGSQEKRYCHSTHAVDPTPAQTGNRNRKYNSRTRQSTLKNKNSMASSLQEGLL